jgi:mono/diheme cytochrome c family protein
VITYAVDGKQYVALTSGNVSRTPVGAVGTPSIVIMALDVKGPSTSLSAISTSAARRESPDRHEPPQIERGRALYAQNCSVCHGTNGEGDTGKSLKGVGSRLTLDATVLWLENPKPPMPKLFPSPLGEQAIRDIAVFIRSL